MLEKNNEYVVDVIDNGFEGEGICKIDNQVIFVPGVVRGEKIKIRIVKVNKNFAFGKLIEIVKKSPFRDKEICEYYYKCGGCHMQHIEYMEQLRIKKEQVKSCMKKENIDAVVNDVIGMGIPYYYRNKVSYPIRQGKDGKNIIGFYAKRSHDIIENNICYIQEKQCDEIAKYVCLLSNDINIKGYNEDKNSGDLKHVVVRKGYHTNEIMVILVTTRKDIKKLELLSEKLATRYKEIKSIVQNVNNSKGNEILSEENIVIYGKGCIRDIIGEKTYEMSASSFYQVNPIQTEVLYNIVKDNLKEDNNKVVLDLYSGVGTIGIFISDIAKKVYGIEIVSEAVEMAKKNVELNNINNVEYICGQTEEKIQEILDLEENIDAIIVDPPRKGLDEKIVDILRKIRTKKIIYVSCNPATLARDIKKLEEIYIVKEINPVDLFPQTRHVECVCVLNRR